MLADLNIHRDLRIHSDATAAIGIARRRGLGKLRHIDVEDLWVQDKVRTKAVDLVKIDGKLNPADLFTKYVEAPNIERAMKFLNLHAETGRAQSAPAASL